MHFEYYTSGDKHIVSDANSVDISEFFSEQMLACWPVFGNGQLLLTEFGTSIALCIDRADKDLFFLDWHHDGRMVPYNGIATEEYVEIDMGGDPFRIPRACLVDATAALDALKYAAHHKTRDPRLNWVRMDEVPFERGWYDG